MKNVFEELTKKLNRAKERISEFGNGSITEMQREKKIWEKQNSMFKNCGITSKGIAHA